MPQRRDETLSEMTDATCRELVRQLILRVQVTAGSVSIVFNASAMAEHISLPTKNILKELRTRLPPDDQIETAADILVLTVPACLWTRGGIKRIEGRDKSHWVTAKPRHDPALIKALALATEWREWIENGEIANLTELSERADYDRKHAHAILKLAFLAPDIQKAISAGRQQGQIRSILAGIDLPLLWAEQLATYF